MARKKKTSSAIKINEKLMHDHYWYPFYISFAVMVAIGFFVSMGYYFDRAEYSQELMDYKIDIEFYTVYDVLTQNYTYKNPYPEEPKFPFYAVGLMVVGMLGLLATKHVMDIKRGVEYGKIKRT